MLALYLLLVAALALFTAYTRNLQQTIVALGDHLDEAAVAHLASGAQRLRTMAVLGGWLAAVGLGLLFIAWWKVVALVFGAFLLLVPSLGALTPRPKSRHYLASIRSDLRRRIARGGRDAGQLRALLARLDRIAETDAT